MRFEFMPRYTKYLCWYKTEVEKERSCGFLGLVSLAVLALCIFLFKGCSEEPLLLKAHYRPEELKMIDIFKHHGSTHPEAMALAVCKTKNPHLMAAIAIKESNGRPKAVGDSGASKGAWQVQEKHWNKVPPTATEQALQAEKILEELVGSTPRRSLYHGLEKYNTGRVGTKAGKRYAADVLRIKRRLG